MAWQADSPAMAPVLSFSVVAAETYARATATLPKTGEVHLHMYHLLLSPLGDLKWVRVSES